MWKNPSEYFATATVMYFERHKGEVNSCALSPDCHFVLTCSDDSCIHLWKAKSGTLKQKVTGHTGPVKSCCFSPEGPAPHQVTLLLFASSSHDCTVRIWKVDNVECLHALREGGTALPYCGKYRQYLWRDPSSSPLYCCASYYRYLDVAKKSAFIYCSKNNGQKLVYEGHRDAIQCSAFSLNGSYIASGTKQFCVWNTHNGSLIFLMNIDSGWHIIGWCIISMYALSIVGGTLKMVPACAFSTDGTLSLTGARGLYPAC
ncbi:hypothetical protein XELAEV_18041820mg [Xenopus laevis]|uniref:Uncharacterized protein n=1 Tax=Xenopus laevis TaxID=8355 RepID=A0A974H5G4_XENLA|nr:hypothetical protein XELAEV_18041820mg [Xenopus laevis]